VEAHLVAQVRLSSPMFSEGFFAPHTDSNPVRLFNEGPQSKGLDCHPLVPMYSSGT
jgi:hypothetical protein